MQDNFYKHYGKRIFDLLISILGTILLSPFLLVIILIILSIEGKPVFYIQSRVGRNFVLFKLIKFRTMAKDSREIGISLTRKNDARITAVGKILRKYKLDELPQLLNVILGDLSMVGPRPEIPEYVELFYQEYLEILKVKPGITDYASLVFRHEEEVLSQFENIHNGYIRKVLPQKIELYKQYINDQSFWTDIRIIFRTFWKIMK